MLFLFFLVVAFAKPFIPAQEQTVNTQNVILYLDNSFSMSAPTQSTERAIDSGIGFIREMVKSFPPATRYRLLTNDFAPFSNSFKSPDQILDLLTQIRLSATSRTAEEVIRRIGADARGADIFWVSDFQKSTFGSGKSLMDDKTAQWHPVPITIAQHSNVYVDSVYLENPFSVDGGKNSIKVKIANTGQQAVDSLMVRLIINNIQSGIASLRIAPNNVAEVTFELAADLSGLNSAQVQVDDFLVGFDNDFYFTLNFTTTIRVVEIKEDLQNWYIKNVFGNSKIFTYAGFQPSNVGYDALEKADLIVLNGLQTFDNSLAAALRTALNKNTGALFLIPGEKPDLNAYKKLLGRSDLEIGTNYKMMPLDEPDLQNPFFKNVFEAQTIPLKMPRAVRLIDWGSHHAALLRFKDTSPFLSQTDNFFLMASPLKKGYTDFYNHALFVPVMYKMAVSAKVTTQSIYHRLTDNLITIKVDSTVGDTPIKLVGEQERVPAQHRVREKVFLEIPKFSMSPGFYYAEHRQDTLNLLAMNLDKRESDLQPYKTAEITSLYGDSSKALVFQTANTKIFAHDIKERYLGTPLWKAALLLALLFLLAEILLIRYLK